MKRTRNKHRDTKYRQIYNHSFNDNLNSIVINII